MMKKVINFLFLLFFPFSIYCQPIEQVYNPQSQIISIAVSKNTLTGSSKELMIRGLGLTGAPYICCSGCPYNFNNLKFHKILKIAYRPFNDFLKPFICTDNIMEECNFSPIDNYVISKPDSNLILRCFLTNFTGFCQSSNFKRIDLTTNGGISFTSKFSNFASFGGFDIAQKNDNIILVITGDSLFKSTNRGSNWFYMKTFTSASFVKLNPYNPAVIYVSTTGGLQLSTDGGANFTNVLNQSFKNISFVDSLILIGFSNNTLYKSTDIGSSWNSLFTSTNWSVNCLEVDPSNNSVIYTGSTNGLWRSTNGGANFTKYFNAFPNSVNVLNVLKDPAAGDTVYAVTPKGIFRVWGTLVDVQNISTKIPDKFEITNIYPNPFNPETTIKFTLNKSDHISLVFLDVTGKEMLNAVSGYFQAGEYTYYLNAESFSSGIYFCVLKGAQIASVKKIVLLK